MKMAHTPHTKDKHTWQEVMEKGIMALCDSLDKVGQAATLDLVVRLSARDRVANELLCLFPKVVSVGEFLSRIPVFDSRKKRTREHKR